MKTVEQLELLNTPRLLSYYKAERKRHIRFDQSYTCECCGMRAWEIDTKWDFTEIINKSKEGEKYLELIKSVLNELPLR